MDIARIHNGVVVNIEVATQEWVDANQGVDGFTFAPYTPEAPAALGKAYDPVTGFEQEPPGAETVTLSADTVTALALTTKQKAVLAAATAPTDFTPNA